MFVKKSMWHYALLYVTILFNACFSQLSFTIVLIEFNCQYKRDGLLQSNAWSMLLMPFAGMPINTLHSLALICTSYFSLLAFHMYSRACINVNYILMCIHHHSSILFLAIYLFEFNLLSLPFFRMATKEGKEKATPKPPARKGTKRAQLRNHNPHPLAHLSMHRGRCNP